MPPAFRRSVMQLLMSTILEVQVDRPHCFAFSCSLGILFPFSDDFLLLLSSLVALSSTALVQELHHDIDIDGPGRMAMQVLSQSLDVMKFWK